MIKKKTILIRIRKFFMINKNNIIKILIILFSISFILYSQNADRNNTAVFFSYIENGNINKVREMIRNGIDVNITDEDNWSALHRAVQYNKRDIVRELLINKKININPTLPNNTILENDGKKWYADGETPLLLASYYGHSEIVIMLLNYGADILAKDNIDGAMAIHIASARGWSRTVLAILESYSAKNVKDIINSVDNTGTTPLMWAAMNNQVSVMNLILKFGAYINAQDDDGWTALHFAAASDSYKAAEMLLNNKANANIKNLDEKKPIDIANDTDMQALLNKYTK